MGDFTFDWMVTMTDPIDEKIEKVLLQNGYSDTRHFDECVAELKALFTEHTKEVDRLARIDEIEYFNDKMYDECASKGEWGIPTKWSKEKYGKDNYADLWTPNVVVHKVFENRLTQLKQENKKWTK